jgi:hypothetical protein
MITDLAIGDLSSPFIKPYMYLIDRYAWGNMEGLQPV